MEKILVSACLLGEKVRFDGGDCAQASPILNQWMDEDRLVPACPEVAGGLPVPRPPAEIQGESVISLPGDDVTAAFILGAERALELCQRHGIQLAVLKEGSPSCGSGLINDGNFSDVKIPGRGVTTQLLEAHCIRVFGEHRLADAAAYLESLENRQAE